MSDLKKCLFCAESIQKEAKKCRYCGEWLDQNNLATVSKPSGKSNKSILGVAIVAFLFILALTTADATNFFRLFKQKTNPTPLPTTAPMPEPTTPSPQPVKKTNTVKPVTNTTNAATSAPTERKKVPYTITALHMNQMIYCYDDGVNQVGAQDLAVKNAQSDMYDCPQGPNCDEKRKRLDDAVHRLTELTKQYCP